MKKTLEEIFGKTLWYVPIVILIVVAIGYFVKPDFLQFIIWGAAFYLAMRVIFEPLVKFLGDKFGQFIGWIRGLFN